jgi:hypothetical protein
MKKTQIVIVFLTILLLIAALAFLIGGDSLFQYNASEKTKIDTLEVTYWNPSGGLMEGSNGTLMRMSYDYPPLPLSHYVKNSVIIVSATVTKSTEHTDEARFQELESPWIYPTNPYGKECYLDVNEILAGDFEIKQIYLKTDIENPSFSVGEEYILFIDNSEYNSSGYQIRAPAGYLINNGSRYEGYSGDPISATKTGLKMLILELK